MIARITGIVDHRADIAREAGEAHLSATGAHAHAGSQQVVRVGLGLLAVVGDDVEAAREQYAFLGSVQGRMTSSPITESLRVNGGQR